MNWLHNIPGWIVAWVLLTVPAFATESASITLDLSNADVESVMKVAAEITGRSFVIDPRVKGTVNVVSGKPIPRSQVYSLITSALRMQGFAVIESNGITKILPAADASSHANSTGQGNGDRLLTQLFPLRNTTAAALVPVLKPLISPTSQITASPNGNILLVTDYAENLRRLADIISILDGASEPDVQVIPLKHAPATDVALQLSQLFATNVTDPSNRLYIHADKFGNNLLVRSGSAQRLAQVRTLAGQLDQSSSSAGNIHVVRLKNAEATALAKTLRAIVSGTPAPTTGSAGLPASSAIPQSVAIPSQNTFTLGGATSQPNMPNMRVAGETGSIGEGAGFIQADPALNALIITASEPVYLNLRRVIDLLDQRRAQIFIEALVVELTTNLSDEFGVQWQAGSGTEKNGAILGTNFSSDGKNIFGMLENLASVKSTGTLGVANGLNIGFFSSSAGLAGLIRALASDSRANILSTPSLLTLDNEEARIVIGQNVPILTGQYVQNSVGATATPFQTIERKDVGLALQVKPQISEGGTVRLQIRQEVSSVQQDTARGPITNKRAIDSSVLVDDGMIVAIGGLMQDSVTKGTEKVSGLGDIPLIGGLFRYNNDTRAKTNLMIFLRPRILRDPVAGDMVTTEIYSKSLDSQATFNQKENVGDGPQLLPLERANR